MTRKCLVSVVSCFLKTDLKQSKNIKINMKSKGKMSTTYKYINTVKISKHFNENKEKYIWYITLIDEFLNGY